MRRTSNRLRSFRGRALLVAGVVVLLLSPAGSGQGQQPELLPNILVIVTDDQRDGTFGVLPRTRQRIVDEGTKFVNAFATTPLCCPSRASIFTGRYAHNHGVLDNDSAGLLDHSVTMQRYLNDAGYLTAAVGKFLNKWDLERDPPHFDRWAIQNGGYFNTTFNFDGEIQEVPGHSVDYVGTTATDYMGYFENDDLQPWFLYVAPYAPHLPAHPSPQHADDSVPLWNQSPAVRERNRSDKPSWVRDRRVKLGVMSKIRRRQMRTLLSVDDLVDRIFGYLAHYQEGRRTLVIFLSDNGFLWGEHGLKKKGHPYTASVEVPLLMRWPGHVARGATDERLVANVDVAPTVLDAAEITPPAAMDGRSLLDPSARARAFLEFWASPTSPIPQWASVRTKRYQYIEYYAEDRTSPMLSEFYRLTNDPWQLENLLNDGNPSNDPNVTKLHEVVQEYSNCVGSECP